MGIHIPSGELFKDTLAVKSQAETAYLSIPKSLALGRSVGSMVKSGESPVLARMQIFVLHPQHFCREGRNRLPCTQGCYVTAPDKP